MLDLGTLKISVQIDDKNAKSKLNDLSNTTQKTESRFGKLHGGVKKFAVGAAAVGAAAIVVGKKIKKLTDSVAQYGDMIDKESQKMGISSEAFQKWDYVLQRNGTSINALKTGLKTFSAQMESGSAAFDKLGVSVKNTDGSFREQEAVLEETIKKLAGVKDATERTALANELFGRRTAQELAPMLNSGAKGIEELQKRAEELGFVMSEKTVKACAEYQDAMLDVEKSTQGLKNNIVAAVIPAVSQMAFKLSDTIGHISTTIHQEVEKSGGKGLFTAIGKLIAQAADKITENAPKILATIGGIVGSIGLEIVKAIPKVLSNIANAISSIGDTIKNADTSSFRETGLKMLKNIGTGIVEAIPQIIANLGDLAGNLADRIGEGDGSFIATGLKLMGSLLLGIIKAIPKLVIGLGKLLLAMIKQIPKFIADMVKAGADLIGGLVQGFLEGHPKLAAAFEAIGKVFDVIKKPFQAVIDFFGKIKEGWDAITKLKKKKKFEVKTPSIGTVIGKMGEVVGNWKDVLEQKAKKQFETAKKGFTTVLDGMKSIFNKWKDILNQKSKKTFTTENKTVNSSSGGKKRKKRIGLREVPYDGYEAELHKGEVVLTAAETNKYKKWLNQTAEERKQKTQQPPQMLTSGIDYKQLASTLLESLSNVNMTTSVNVDGRTLAQTTAPFMKNAINKLDSRQNRKLGYV